MCGVLKLLLGQLGSEFSGFWDNEELECDEERVLSFGLSVLSPVFAELSPRECALIFRVTSRFGRICDANFSCSQVLLSRAWRSRRLIRSARADRRALLALSIGIGVRTNANPGISLVLEGQM